MNDAAWSLTAMGADISDIYYERIDGNRYLFDGKWRDLEIRKEYIEVKGEKEPVEFIVRLTKNGPLIHEHISEMNYAFVGKINWDKTKPISIRWSATEHAIDKF